MTAREVLASPAVQLFMVGAPASGPAYRSATTTPLSEVRCRLEPRTHNVAGPIQAPSRFLIDDLARTDRVKNARQAANLGGGIAVEDDEIGVKSFLYAALL
jgi:hypothetical protein